MRSKSIPYILCIMSCWVPQALRAEISGYLKSLWLTTDMIVGESTSVGLATNRARFTWRESDEDLQFLMSYDLEWQLGTYLESTQYALQRALAVDPYWKLQGSWQRNGKEIINHGVYRAFVTLPVGQTDIRFGRQQLNWSRTFLWSSFDRFNPYNPLQVEPEERLGVDALQLVHNFDDGSSAELVTVGHVRDTTNEEASWGIRYRGNVMATDVDLMIAQFGGTKSLGVAAAGQLGNAGWRMEITRNWPDSTNMPGIQGNYEDLVLSVNYSFASGTTLIAEALYRGDGADNPQQYDFTDYLASRRTDLARRYLGLVLRRDPQPITGYDLAMLYNADDDSLALVPSLTYSPGRYENLGFRAGLQLFGGPKGSEYGSLEPLGFIELKWFF